jgi:hypothetical protein
VFSQNTTNQGLECLTAEGDAMGQFFAYVMIIIELKSRE